MCISHPRLYVHVLNATYNIHFPMSILDILCNTLLILQHWMNLCCLGNIPPRPSGYQSESSMAPPTIRTSTPQRERHPTPVGEKEEGMEGRNQEVAINSVINMHWTVVCMESKITQSVYAIN